MMIPFILTLWGLWFAHEHEGQGLVECSLGLALMFIAGVSLLGLVVGTTINDFGSSHVVSLLTR
jgi:hypothetical protein